MDGAASEVPTWTSPSRPTCGLSKLRVSGTILSRFTQVCAIQQSLRYRVVFSQVGSPRTLGTPGPHLWPGRTSLHRYQGDDYLAPSFPGDIGLRLPTEVALRVKTDLVAPRMRRVPSGGDGPLPDQWLGRYYKEAPQRDAGFDLISLI